jgi:putative endonuclease
LRTSIELKPILIAWRLGAKVVGSNPATPTKVQPFGWTFSFMFVYILFSPSFERYYSGHSDNFQRRIQEHNAGKTPSIKNEILWKLVWSTMTENHQQAMALEKKIKSRGAKRFFEDLNRN